MSPLCVEAIQVVLVRAGAVPALLQVLTQHTADRVVVLLACQGLRILNNGMLISLSLSLSLSLSIYIYIRLGHGM